MQRLRADAGLHTVETRDIRVQRTFADFDDFWTTSTKGETIAPSLAMMSARDVELVKMRVRAPLPADAMGHITYGAHANAIKGRVPPMSCATGCGLISFSGPRGAR